MSLAVMMRIRPLTVLLAPAPRCPNMSTNQIAREQELSRVPGSHHDVKDPFVVPSPWISYKPPLPIL